MGYSNFIYFYVLLQGHQIRKWEIFHDKTSSSNWQENFIFMDENELWIRRLLCVVLLYTFTQKMCNFPIRTLSSSIYFPLSILRPISIHLFIVLLKDVKFYKIFLCYNKMHSLPGSLTQCPTGTSAKRFVPFYCMHMEK